ncbi:MAG: biopolymer transporter ExbD [Pseudanabaenaceae cyanobacterium SKYGB_i_bin29]|nr:biopolymer transporter ExbD [Pseudanabaenaceae cyanobacterium SKYG29]MDW8421643.1 biopolymer transporter ExbD [Pseudanabaenaceae cyanobacterium SKYGB_i_bin29]
MRLPEEPEQPAIINVTSLIDVTFAILAFLVIYSLFLSPNLGISLNLPQARTARTQTSQRLLLSILQDGKIMLEDREVKLDRLAAVLQQKKGQNPELLVYLQADEAIDYGQVVSVIDVLREVEGVKMALATKKKQ